MERRNGIGLFSFFILFTIGCSESDSVSPPLQATYVPFSSETFSPLNSEGRKKLNQMKVTKYMILPSTFKNFF